MKIKHHIVRKYHESKQAPLWKWIIIILLALALPFFFTFVDTTQIQQVFYNQQN